MSTEKDIIQLPIALVNQNDYNTPMKMSVSSAVGKGPGRKIYILFEEGSRSCEGVYPDCTIMNNKGFSSSEVRQLESFIRENSEKIKEMAKSVSIWKAFQ